MDLENLKQGAGSKDGEVFPLAMRIASGER
jgi:hypothetical protein